LYYVPIVPMVLFTKSQGIGTGFSTNIPQFNPEEVVEALINKLKNPELNKFNLKPWFLGFTGKVIKKESPESGESKDSYTT
jgi:DNA topoisomerase-2